jgi:uncharacterized membrane protein YkoI
VRTPARKCRAGRQLARPSPEVDPITEAELEEEDGRLIYSFEIKVAGKAGEDEVEVDARTGEVVKQEHEG